VSTLRLLEVIKPTIPPPKEALLKTLYYPYMIYHVRVIVRRALGKPSYLHGFVIVDLTRAMVLLADSFPQTFKIQVSEESILPERIDESRATYLAKKKMTYVAMRKYKIFLPPKVEIERSKKVYKQYWVVNLKGKIYVVDSLTGDAELVE